MPRERQPSLKRTANEGPASAAPYEEFSQAWPALHEAVRTPLRAGVRARGRGGVRAGRGEELAGDRDQAADLPQEILARLGGKGRSASRCIPVRYRRHEP
jgi:hypothetical protein